MKMSTLFCTLRCLARELNICMEAEIFTRDAKRDALYPADWDKQH